MKQVLIFCAILGLTAAESELSQRQKFGQRIVGGVAAYPGQFNYAVSLHYGGGHICGGSILSENWTVTAAHCCFGNMGNYEVVAGEHDRSVEDGTEQRIKVIKMVPHPQYDDYDFYYDVCMLEMEKPFIFNDYVDKIDPAVDYYPNPDVPDDFTVIGWGNTQENGSPANILQYVDVPYVDRDKCNAAYSIYGYNVSDDMICAGDFDDGGKDSCQGDSGGPMVFHNAVDGKPALIGIVSWGIGCARAGYPGVYSYVPASNDFIQDCLSGNAPEPAPCSGFECGNGQCLPPQWECDGYIDCDTDEAENCICTGYQCDDGKCIPAEWECDGIIDCDSDELCINTRTSSPTLLTILSGKRKRTNNEIKP